MVRWERRDAGESSVMECIELALLFLAGCPRACRLPEVWPAVLQSGRLLIAGAVVELPDDPEEVDPILCRLAVDFMVRGG